MTTGILGGGQLGRMLALAGYPLGLHCRFLDPAPQVPVTPLAAHLQGAYDDEATLQRFVEGLSVVTYEFENVPVTAAHWLAAYIPVYPPPQALAAAQDRLSEKTLFQRLGIPTSPFMPVTTEAELSAAVATLGLPAVLKTRRLGYDGKGQYVLRAQTDVAHAWAASGGVPLLLEGLVPFERELSLVAVRGRDGQTVFYPVVENHHRDGILRLSIAPAPGWTPALQAHAEGYVCHLLDTLQYVGVLTVEFFQCGDALLANEMAPRVHNSGHWTIEGAETSQFENHLRAVTGLPLGAPTARGYSAMLNIIGCLPPSRAVLAVPGAHLHLYDKTPRPGRKLGHVTLRHNDPNALRRQLTQLCEAHPAWRHHKP
ncbi:MAG: 5-(carboxyamino)imidazole ribonucleotide synthase [Candidatus Tectomicrobia bacterium]|uniref:N5-carboxyaminoimidazole ribonucleotide synthase n=1 Tax=Tectimicrobiota bacterium TaxID=2528274 RepID=A0A937VZY8_UNCTE|nr:5-(carboxyamino)imidazole ribonucleotide synthase [Candidatus Tectomicrobia bacterium]